MEILLFIMALPVIIGLVLLGVWVAALALSLTALMLVMAFSTIVELFD